MQTTNFHTNMMTTKMLVIEAKIADNAFVYFIYVQCTQSEFACIDSFCINFGLLSLRLFRNTNKNQFNWRYQMQKHKWNCYWIVTVIKLAEPGFIHCINCIALCALWLGEKVLRSNTNDKKQTVLFVPGNSNNINWICMKRRVNMPQSASVDLSFFCLSWIEFMWFNFNMEV